MATERLRPWQQLLTDTAPTDPKVSSRYVVYTGSTFTEIITDAAGNEYTPAAGGGGSVAWGSITGTLTDQTDLVTALGLKADKATTVSAGTGLTGGGDLSTNRTIDVDFGTGAGEVCEGNDARLSDARTPTSHTHPSTDITGLGSMALASASPIQCGRLTLTSGVPVTTTDVTGASTIYYTPHIGDVIALYDGTTWTPRVFTELSRSISGLTSGKNYDVVLYLNGSTLTLDLMPAWTSNTARASAISFQNGTHVNTSSFTSVMAGHSVSAARAIVVGTIRATGTSTTEDSMAKRLICNSRNVHMRYVTKASAGGVHNYDTNTWRAWANDATNIVEWLAFDNHMVGTIQVTGSWIAGSTTGLGLGLGIDSTTSAYNPIEQFFAGSAGGTTVGPIYTGIGYHYGAAVQRGGGATSTFFYANLGGHVWS